MSNKKVGFILISLWSLLFLIYGLLFVVLILVLNEVEVIRFFGYKYDLTRITMYNDFLFNIDQTKFNILLMASCPVIFLFMYYLSFLKFLKVFFYKYFSYILLVLIILIFLCIDFDSLIFLDMRHKNYSYFCESNFIFEFILKLVGKDLTLLNKLLFNILILFIIFNLCLPRLSLRLAFTLNVVFVRVFSLIYYRIFNRETPF